MNLINAFLVSTAFCYFFAFVMVWMGYPALNGPSKLEQSMLYLVSFSAILIVAFYPDVIWLNFLLGLFYCFATGGSFIGYPQVWNAYWTSNPGGGSAIAQVGMAFWNLALATIFFSLC